MIAKPVIIDVEASGFGRGSYPIEVGFANADGGSYCAIIHPDNDWQHWDEAAEALHGISRQTLLEYGQGIQQVAKTLNQVLTGQVVYSDAWGNDSSWLALLFEYAQIPQRFRVESLRNLLTDSQLEVWHDTKQRVITEFGFQRHRASHDALVIQQTFCLSAGTNTCG